MGLYYPYQKLKNQQSKHRKIKPRVIYILVLSFSLLLLFKWFTGSHREIGENTDFHEQSESYGADLSSEESQASACESQSDILEGPLPHPSFFERRLTGKIRHGESIYQCLHKEGISDRNIQLIADHLDPLLSFRYQSRPGDTYHLTLTEEGEIERFEYRKGLVEIYCLTRDRENTWNVWRENIKLSKYWVNISGQIKGSLFSTFQELGYPVALAIRFAEILEWKIDFQHEVREGDSFGVVFERFFKGDEPIGYGKILAVMYDGQVTGSLRGFHFDLGDNQGDYFDLNGISLRRAFLRAPLSYKYISSGFSHHRMHPILNRVRPHLGIDFAAPHGSPVWAVADGTVLSKSYDENNGNQVKLRHMNGYITYYNHLSKFAKGLKKGDRVVQKQIIGYVGTTGLSTGPHLDYRVKKDGKFINPLNARYPSGKPLKRDFIGEFQQKVAKLTTFLNGHENVSKVLVAEVDTSELPRSIL